MADLTGRGIQPGLNRIKKLLELWGNPERGLACVHVGGTNGKGTTAQIISRTLTLAGYVTARFTSPHLLSYTERFTIDDRPISPEKLSAYLEELEMLVRQAEPDGLDLPTEFELLTAIAFKYFADSGVEWAVIEVGLGGTFDSTNVIVPRLSVITGVAYDHMSFLGNTLAQIAENKAGIIKAGVPVVTGRMAPEAKAVINTEAHLLDAPVLTAEQIAVTALESGVDGQKISVRGFTTTDKCYFYRLSGPYQRDNLAVALTALKELRRQGVEIPEKALCEALQQVVMPGRMETLSKDPLVIADVAHNPQGAEALSKALREILPNRRKILVTAILDDKDKETMLRFWGENTVMAIFTRPFGSRGENWKETVQLWQHLYPDIPAYVEGDIVKAVERSLAEAEQADYILVTGSFYLMEPVCRYFQARN